MNPPCCSHTAGQKFPVQRAIGQQSAQHHTVHPQRTALLNLPQCSLLFRGGEAEIAKAGAQQHIHRNMNLLHHLAHQRNGGAGSPNDQIATQFQTVGAACLGGQSGVQRIHADLQQMFHDS